MKNICGVLKYIAQTREILRVETKAILIYVVSDTPAGGWEFG